MQLRLLADDTPDYWLSTCPTILQFHTNEDLVLLNNCLADNYLIVNSAKTQAMVLGSSNHNFSLVLNDRDTELKNELKLLDCYYWL